MGLNRPRSGWGTLSYVTKKAKIVEKLLVLLHPRVALTNLCKAVEALKTTKPVVLVRTMDKKNFESFMKQLGSQKKKYKWGSRSHGSNIEFETRIRITYSLAGGFSGPVD